MLKVVWDVTETGEVINILGLYLKYF